MVVDCYRVSDGYTLHHTNDAVKVSMLTSQLPAKHIQAVDPQFQAHGSFRRQPQQEGPGFQPTRVGGRSTGLGLSVPAKTGPNIDEKRSVTR